MASRITAPLAAALLLGLAACSQKTQDTTADAANSAMNDAAANTNQAMTSADNAADAAGPSLDQAGNSLDNAADATGNAMSRAGNSIRNDLH